jgi:hypothetical protein
MQLRKTLIAALGLAVAFAFAPIAPQAAPGLGLNAEFGSTSLIDQVAAKKKAKKGKAKAKKGKSKASKAGRCGTGKYWSRSKRSCQDAALGPAKK